MNKFLSEIKKRIGFLLKTETLKFIDRIKSVFHKNMVEFIVKILLKKNLVSDDNEPYFRVGYLKIFFKPDYVIKNKDKLLRGVAVTLSEVLFFPEFLNSKVSLNDGDVVFDVGAFIGLTSIFFSKKVGQNGRIYAIEPVMHNVIMKNIKENNINNVKIIPKAIGEKVGTTEIEISDFCADSSISQRNYTKDYYSIKKEVAITSLDSLIENLKLKRIDLIQIDIEGAEELAIKGAVKLIKKYKPKWSISSYHIDHENEYQHVKLVDLLLKFGYSVKQIGQEHIYAW